MAYLAVLLTTILISFLVVRIGGFALQLTGLEPSVANFQALSAFSGTGFTTSETERAVRHPARRRIITALIILGNAGLVALIATSITTFTKVGGYGWFLARLAIVILAIVLLYQLVIRSRAGNWALGWIRRPLFALIVRESPAAEEIFRVEGEHGVFLLTVRPGAPVVDTSIGEFKAQAEVDVLALQRIGATVSRPEETEVLRIGDRIVAYGDHRSIRPFLDIPRERPRRRRHRVWPWAWR